MIAIRRSFNRYRKYQIRCKADKKSCNAGHILSLIGFLFLLVLAWLFAGCRTVKYVPVETVRTEYVNRTDTFIQKDSVFYHDSVYIHSKGDTVWFEKWHTKYKDRIVTKVVIDSFIKTDSIQVPYPVEKKLTRWQTVKMQAGGAAIIFCFVVILILVVGLVIKKKFISLR